MATIRKRNNTYLITVSCGYDITGKQIRRTMTYKPEPGMNQRQIDKEVQRQAVLFEEDCQKGKILKGNIKLADFIELYFENYAEVTLKKRTVFGYRAHVPYVNQALGHLRIDRIQPHHLNEFYKQLSTVGSRKKDVYKPLTNFRALLKDKGVTIAQAARDCEVKENTLRGVLNNKPVYKPTAQALCKYLKLDIKKVFEKETRSKPLSAETVRHYHRFLSSVFSAAVKWEMIESNPCSRATLPKGKRSKPRYLDEEQAAQLLELLEKEDMQHKTMIKMFMYLGLRREELCGLEWKDIDFDNAVVRIERTSIYIPKEGVITDDGKTSNSHRYIKAPTAAIQMLKDFRAWQDEYKMIVGDRWEEHDKIFTKDNGKPIHPDTITGWFRRFILKNDLPDISIHSLRHTNATLLINSGIPITTISARLGHANPSTTTKIYTHAIQSADAAAADTLDNIFTSNRNRDKNSSTQTA